MMDLPRFRQIKRPLLLAALAIIITLGFYAPRFIEAPRKSPTLFDIYRDHYHAAEFHDGDLYVIVRPGGADAYVKNPNWTDELWKYPATGPAVKIYSAKGIDFRVSSEAKRIVIFSRPDPKKVLEETIVVMDLDGRVLKTIAGGSLPGMDATKTLKPLGWQGQEFQFAAIQGGLQTDAYSMNARDLSVQRRSR